MMEVLRLNIITKSSCLPLVMRILGCHVSNGSGKSIAYSAELHNYRPRTKYDGRLYFQFVCQSTGGWGGGSTLLTGPWSLVPGPFPAREYLESLVPGVSSLKSLVRRWGGRVLQSLVPDPLWAQGRGTLVRTSTWVPSPSQGQDRVLPPILPPGQDQDRVALPSQDQDRAPPPPPPPQDTTCYRQDTPRVVRRGTFLFNL